MQFIRRFADYGLTGGFFLICQLVVLWPFGYLSTIVHKLQALPLPSLTDTSLVGPISQHLHGSKVRCEQIKQQPNHEDSDYAKRAPANPAQKVYCATDYETIRRAFRFAG